jgi:hypothetical protein
MNVHRDPSPRRSAEKVAEGRMRGRADTHDAINRKTTMSRTTVVLVSIILAFFALAALAQQDPQGVKVPDAEQFVGNPQGTPLAGDELTRKTWRPRFAVRSARVWPSPTRPPKWPPT